MLQAEGPEAFQEGYHKMQANHVDDEAKLRYIDQLFNDPDKAHFKRALRFTNGTLVDLCETLFNAVKVWVNGSSRRTRTTLLMAFVRIVRGVYNMICREFLHPVAAARRATRTMNAQVAAMFRAFSSKLTKRAVEDMFKSLDGAWCSYQVQSNMDKSVTLISDPGDEFQVLPDFSCECEGVPCWQQKHSGLLCKHALNACVYRLRQEEDKDVRERIIETAVKKCDKNWLRATYKTVAPPSEFPKPVSLEYNASTSARSSMSTRNSRELHFIRRFREVLNFVSPEVVEKKLHELESYALTECDDTSSTESGDVGYTSDSWENESSSVQTATESSSSVSNPPRRGPKRRRQTHEEDIFNM